MIDKEHSELVIGAFIFLGAILSLLSFVFKEDRYKHSSTNRVKKVNSTKEKIVVDSSIDDDLLYKDDDYSPSETAGKLSGKDDDPEVDEEESIYKSIDGKEDHPSILLGAYSQAHRINKLGRKNVNLLILQYSNAFFAKVNDVYHYLNASNHIEAKAQACALIEGK